MNGVSVDKSFFRGVDFNKFLEKYPGKIQIMQDHVFVEGSCEIVKRRQDAIIVMIALIAIIGTISCFVVEKGLLYLLPRISSKDKAPARAGELAWVYFPVVFGVIATIFLNRGLSIGGLHSHNIDIVFA